jgi:proline iminopeptidase
MIRNGYLQTLAGELFYEERGTADNLPLVAVHGGPGFTGYCLSSLFELSEERPVIVYDQAGCGRARRSGGRKNFSLEGFVEELEQLRRTLGYEKLHLLGHSFGGVIIGEYALRYPAHVERLIFACVSIDIPRWIADGERLLGGLSLMERMIVREGGRSGATSSPEYIAALKSYYAKHIYGGAESNELIQQSEREADAQTYQIVWGTNELVVNGIVKDYSLTPRLSQIVAPSLFMCGRFDEATPEAHEFFASKVSGATCHIFEKSAHHPFITEKDETNSIVRAFLRAT